MVMCDIIAKKRDKKPLSNVELSFIINGYLDGSIPDYQISAFLMATYLNGMTDQEVYNLTRCMAKSGEILDLSDIKGIKVDKHSTGGVGDKTTLIVVAMVAACGVYVPKMSGKGLGHTGGTIDKLESIPGLKTSFEKEEFIKIVQKTGACIAGQSKSIAPADKKLYALRDVTATADSIPLIASSIMSKKIASGADGILLDVKVGSGAFMKNIKDGIKLAKTMISIGVNNNKRTIALITNMDNPLGNAIGNSLEIMEACDVLKGKGPEDLKEICINIAANMLYLANRGSFPFCYELSKKVLEDGRAFKKFKEIVEEQGGDTSVLDDYSKFRKAKVIKNVSCNTNGYLHSLNSQELGLASMALGAGRSKKEDRINYSAGIVLKKKPGDYIRKGEVLATLYSSSEERCFEGVKRINNAVCISSQMPEKAPIIYAKIDGNTIERFFDFKV